MWGKEDKETKQVCRLCLVTTPVFYSLLEDTNAKMLESLTSIKVNPEDLVNAICTKCLLNLTLAYKIQQKMVESNAILIRDLPVKPTVIKIEMEGVDIQCAPPCLICGFNYKYLRSHIQRHFEEDQTCLSCRESFTNVKLYREHLKKHHPDRGLFKCKNCEASFKYETFYEKHMEMVHAKSFRMPEQPAPTRRGFMCDLCQKTFKHRWSRNHHLICHERIECSVCHKTVGKGRLKKHMEFHSDGPQICDICGLTTKNRSCLRAHVKYSHEESTRFPCKDCEKVFRKPSLRDYHHRTEHSGAPTHVCDTCGKKFFSKERLTIHVKMTHLKLRPHVCEFCGKAFSSKFALRTHSRQHTDEKPFRCDICAEGFRQKVSLKGHYKSKHKIEDPITCTCKVCGKGFSSEWALKSHARLHR